MNRKTTLRPRLLALVAIVALCAAGQGRGARRGTGAKSPASQAVAQIPIELSGNQIFLRLRVNGSEPLWFGLDTGAGGSVINTTTAEALGLKMEGSYRTAGAGGQVNSSTVRGVRLDIGGARLENLDAMTIALTSIENATGHKMDGILGYEFFRRYVVELDYENLLVSVYEPAGFEYKGGGESLPLTFELNHPYVRAKVAAQGREPVEGKFVLDTGSNFPLILLDSFVREKRLAESNAKTLKVTGRGVGGEVQMPVGRTGRLLLGSYSLENPVTSFPQSGWFAREGAAGNIGGAVLRRFKVTFDYSRGRMFVEPNKRFSEPFEYDMSGLQVVTESPSFKTFTVLRVLSGSPAAEAGLRQGDEIVSIGGRPVAELKLATLREMLRQPDRRYALEVRRGAETVNAELKTRRLL
ncbi:MAG TPA: aspartyl protease family protein [Pyrinomonadaceae bacterium]|nr:aspartyl protease family protein [Pyrinomonadaceae bacterium]